MNNISKAAAVKSLEMVKKHKVLRSLLVNVPEKKYIDNEKLLSFVNALNKSASIENQIEIIHNIFKCTSTEDDKFELEKYELLIFIYFDVFIKHPAKAVISNLFNNSSKINEPMVIKLLSASIQQVLKNTKGSLEDMNLTVSELNECLQFKLAVEAIRLNDELVLSLANQAMAEYFFEFKTSLSPALKNEISTYLHQVIQLVISCMKNFLLNRENNEKAQQLIELYLNGIEKNAEELLNNPDLPVDSKANLGILIFSKSRITNDDAFYKMIMDISDEPVKRMCLIVGFVCTMDSKNLDFSQWAEVTSIITQLHKENSMDPAINLGVSRYFLQTTKKLLMSKLKPEDLTEPNDAYCLLDTANLALSFSINNIEHFMDSCRYLSKDCIKNLCEFAAKYKWSQLMDSIFDHIFNASSNNLKTLLISMISSTLTFKEISTKIPGIKQKLLRSIESSNSTVNQNVLNSYETLMYNDKKIEKKLTIDEEWNHAWIEPVIRELIFQQNDRKKTIVLENLLKKCVKKDPAIVSSILKYKKELESGFVLLCLGAAKKNGHTSQENFVIYDEIKNLMLLADDDIKISALTLIGESQKITEVFNSKDFECILLFLEYNVNVQNPSVRQQILGVFKNIFARIEKSLGVLFRKNEEETIEQYFNFLGQLQDFCLINLFPGANFTRKTLSLRLLYYVVKLLNHSFPTKLDALWNQSKWDLLENNLEADTYETNKEITINLMMFIPKSIILKLSRLNIDSTKKLIKNIKPTASITASYQLEFIARFLPTAVKQFSSSSSMIEPEFYSIIRWCELLLTCALTCAENSLAKAASENPIYGTILCIRHLLSKIDLNQISTCKLWCQLHDNIIKLCRRASAVVSPALICSAPEGFSLDTEDDQEVLTNVACFEATPQMVLLCAWRTVKEVSLIFGDICLNAPIKSDTSNIGLITCSQLFTIGDGFIWLLSQLKHRGAFEQAFVGYSKLCERLYSAKEKELHELPHNMLQQLMISISNDENENDELCIMSNLCSTRRSAGLPFMIQALLTAELKIGSSNGLHSCMKYLIELCRNGKSLQSRVHSLNVLRALYRSTELAEPLAEYVSEGFICAVLGFSQDSFIERNSSTLLFAALITRIFGVQRTKNSQNLLTGKVFFMRYPQLFDFIIDKFQEALQFIWREGVNGKPTNVVSILLFLLSRLYPSQNEACDSNFKLTKLVPLVSIFSGNQDLETRTLSAKFIAVAIRPLDFFDRIQTILKALGENNRFSSNSVHGALLQLLYLIRGTPLNTSFFEFSQIIFMLDQLSILLNCYAYHPVLVSAILDVVLEVFARSLNDLENNSALFNAHLSKFITLSTGHNKKELISIKESNIVLLYLINVKFDDNNLNHVKDFVEIRDKFGLNHQQAALNMILLILDFSNTSDMVDEYNIKPLELFFAKNLFGKEVLENMRENLKNDTILMAQMKKFTHKRLFYDTTVKSYEILCLLQHSSSVVEAVEINELIQDAIGQPDSLKQVMFKYIGICLFICPDFEDIDYMFLLELSTDGSVSLKFTIMEIIRLLVAKMQLIKSFDVILNLSRSIFNMLMDDDPEIRYEMSSIITNLYYKEADESTNGPAVAIYAQQMYLSLFPKLLSSFDLLDQIALIMGIFLIENDAQDGNSAAEYRVFDKNEANIFREDFKIKQDCLKAIKKLLNTNNVETIDILEKLCITMDVRFKGHTDKVEKYLTTSFVYEMQSL